MMNLNGPVNIVRSNKSPSFEYVKPLYEWFEKDAYLLLDEIKVGDTGGAIVYYHNPPLHQVGNPILDAYFAAMTRVQDRQKELHFLIMYSANDPVHAGADLKESLVALDRTLVRKKDLIAQGATDEEIDRLYHWAEDRLHKGFRLYQVLNQLRKHTRLIGICGGGARYGGSAELVLMADIIIGDSRSSICFSEVLIGIIPAWGGIGRIVSKAGILNAKYLAYTANECRASDLKNIGILNAIVEVPFALPRMQKTDNLQNDKIKYNEALQKNNDETGLLLLTIASQMAICPASAIPKGAPQVMNTLLTESALQEVVGNRTNQDNYKDLVNKPLSTVKEEIAKKGRPLAPQSVEALNSLFAGYDASIFDEEKFIEKEMKLDAQLYRDLRLRAGITATLEQKVPDFG